ncbi:unnamed protein product [Darwinula stevensoni]|uniref:CSN8/PSMD8/EIF3K domain-containing protein n=1 Tax=Darwinula stevensoni TaxID=69355 RepID=A0A7R8X987_9CRUS|nr:unnamed protein product [Darwinula stevensoni]CAG0889435.1 unnamed protein product [Darwinula stevensoni]
MNKGKLGLGRSGPGHAGDGADFVKEVEVAMRNLEQQELKGFIDDAAADNYAQLLCCYLYTYDLCNAKMLWKRIPQRLKVGELAAIWKLGTFLWKKDYIGFYAAARGTEWSDPVKDILKRLIGLVQNHCVDLVREAYSSADVQDVSAVVGGQEFIPKDWIVEGDLVYPTKPTPPEQIRIAPRGDELAQGTSWFPWYSILNESMNLRSSISCARRHFHVSLPYASATKDWVGPRDPVSNIRPLKLPSHPQDSKKELEDLQQWHQEFWTTQNKLYAKEKEEWLARGGDLSEFHKNFLDVHRRTHIEYTKEWYKRNTRGLWTQLKTVLSRMLRT